MKVTVEYGPRFQEAVKESLKLVAEKITSGQATPAKGGEIYDCVR